MYPNRQTAIEELALAETFNPGKWADHSRNVALAYGTRRMPTNG